ncbi:hypothetical protein GCM10010193_62350 [Kitasatospora atroaurantiaca]|uniref:Uncharacterized protein n=1 Tax=Kitasatospora atroaurantiaca TaxID=285545 RepID=A0A561F1V7_9ACTN|nr:hypothetical protein [Kitasatospora atroaurantiaca]TWE21844.1 hypothetical protein FB465_7077 [Kitasatospora atroaurantiaca]
MDDMRFDRRVTIYLLSPKGDTTAEGVAAAVRRLGDILTAGQPRRTGNITRIRLLHDQRDDRFLLLVSTDTGISPGDRIDELSPAVAVQNMGFYAPITLPSVTDDDLAVDPDDPDAREFDLGRGISIAEVRPRPGKSDDDVAAAVDSRLVPFLRGGASRVGQVVNVSLLAQEDGDRRLVFFGLDSGVIGGFDHRVDEVGDAAAVTPVGFFGQLPLSGAFPAGG